MSKFSHRDIDKLRTINVEKILEKNDRDDCYQIYYKIFKQIDLEKYRPKIVRLEWINLSEEEQELIKLQFEKHNYVVELTGQDIVGLPKEFHDERVTV